MTARQIEKELNRQAVQFEEQCKNGMTGAAGNLRLSAAPMLKASGQPYENGRTASPATVKRKLAVLQSMLTFAYKLGYIFSNPADTRRLTLPKQIQPEIQIFTKQEAAQILCCLKNEPL